MSLKIARLGRQTSRWHALLSVIPLMTLDEIQGLNSLPALDQARLVRE